MPLQEDRMSSSDRSNGSSGRGRGPDAKRTEDEAPAPVERSSRGRILIRSSSHPPGGEPERRPGETSGEHLLPESPIEPRLKRDTPAERPRRRRQVKAAQAAALEPAKVELPPVLAASSERSSDVRSRLPLVGTVVIAAIAAAVLLWRWLVS
jgi:hypothetical protein